MGRNRRGKSCALPLGHCCVALCVAPRSLLSQCKALATVWTMRRATSMGVRGGVISFSMAKTGPLPVQCISFHVAGLHLALLYKDSPENAHSSITVTIQYMLLTEPRSGVSIPSATWGGVGYFYVDPKRGV